MTDRLELLPRRSWFEPGENVLIDVESSAPLTSPIDLVVRHWGDEVDRHRVDAAGTVAVGPLAPGGYGIELVDEGGVGLAHTAVDVRGRDVRRMRYGFVVDFQPERDPAGVSHLVRRFHLTAIQFYDWGYRHADLIGPDEQYADPLGRPVSRSTVERLIGAVQAAGAVALGYAAVYAVGHDEWERWAHDALIAADGRPYALGDFLRIVDPAADDWLEHFCAELVESSRLGFDGFHLDQYGCPKRARRYDGAVVDVADSFVRLIGHVRAALPTATLVFNNVNDFGTHLTKHAPQDAVYIEPWSPNTTLGALGRLAIEARDGTALPVVLAAYQSVYGRADVGAADRAAALTMATVHSHGATQLLIGEADRMLIDPYYVNNQRMSDATTALMHRWYDFLVEHDELLLDPAIRDVTASTAGAYNDDIVVEAPEAAVSTEARAGTVWQRNTAAGDRHVVHLINLVAQSDTSWDEPRERHRVVSGTTLRVRAVSGCRTRIRVADPDDAGRLVDVDVAADGTHVVATLPPLQVWQLILVEQVGVAPADTS